MCETYSTNSTFVPAMVTSHIPFLGIAKRLKRALAHTLPFSDEGISVECSESSSTSTSTSGSATPVIQAISFDVLSTQFDNALCASQSRKDGIDWTSAALGQQMLISASHKAQCNNDLLARTMYIDALKYLNSSLPADLSTAEQQSLYAFLPTGSLQVEGSVRKYSVPESPSWIRSSTASFVASLIGLLMLVVPVLVEVINRISEYERNQRIIPRVVIASRQALYLAGMTGLAAGERIFSLSQSQITAYAVVGIIQIMTNIANGISDGLERGFQSCKSNDKAQSRRAY